MPTPSSGSAAKTATSPSPQHGSAEVLTDEARAGALWAFLKVQAPRFTFDEALEVVRSLQLTPNEDHKTLAKRLRKALQDRRIALKHVNALHAAARLSGHASWHSVEEPTAPRLRFETFEDRMTKLRKAEFASWSDLATALRAWADRLHASGQLPLGVLTMSFTGYSLNFSAPVPKHGGGAGPGRNEQVPLGGVAPMASDDPDWLIGAPAALEKLRRHLEETGKAVLDGYAALYLCANADYQPAFFDSLTAKDVVNSELVLVREPNEDDPHSGYEIARGDELTCWHQLELSLREDGSERSPAFFEVHIPAEGVGAWFVNGERYIWALETLKPNEYVPGRINRQLGIPDCERLLRRYKLAKRIHSGGFRHHDMTKRLGYLSGPGELWRVDLHRLLRLLNDAGLTWEGYIEKFGTEELAMEPTLPVGFVMQLMENLQVKEPNKLFAWPNLSEMELVTDDKLLYSLLPRVDTVRFMRPKGLDPETEAELHKAVDDFASGLNLQKMSAAGAIHVESELPYLVHANDAQELRMSTEALGLKLSVAVSPHLFSTEKLLPAVPGVKSWPWALGHALLLQFVRRGDAQ